MNQLIIWGAGGHGKVVLNVARCTGRYRSIRFIDDGRCRVGQVFCGCTVAAAEKPEETSGVELVVAIGPNHVRARKYMIGRAWNVPQATLIHPSAILDDSASIGPGSVVMPGAVVNAQATIGANCIINTGVIVEHDCRIEDHCHLSPRVVLGGEVIIRAYANIGLGAVILPRVEIGEGAVVGAGAVVLHSVEPLTTVVGVPAAPLVNARSQLASRTIERDYV